MHPARRFGFVPLENNPGLSHVWKNSSNPEVIFSEQSALGQRATNRTFSWS